MKTLRLPGSWVVNMTGFNWAKHATRAALLTMSLLCGCGSPSDQAPTEDGSARTSSVLALGSRGEDDSALEAGVRAFQRLSGSTVTGVADDATRALMTAPRCRHPDVDPEQQDSTPKFAIRGETWPRTNQIPDHNLHGRPAVTLVEGKRWAGIQIYRVSEQSGPEPLGARMAPSDGLLVSYTNLGATPFDYLMVFAVDAEHEVRWLYPAYEMPGDNPSRFRSSMAVRT
jgi:hypothetical protein